MRDDKRKKRVLNKLCNRWKDHKSHLHRYYILEGRDEDPLAKYHIKPHDWEVFEAYVQTDEFQVQIIKSPLFQKL